MRVRQAWRRSLGAAQRSAAGLRDGANRKRGADGNMNVNPALVRRRGRSAAAYLEVGALGPRLRRRHEHPRRRGGVLVAVEAVRSWRDGARLHRNVDEAGRGAPLHVVLVLDRILDNTNQHDFETPYFGAQTRIIYLATCHDKLHPRNRRTSVRKAAYDVMQIVIFISEKGKIIWATFIITREAGWHWTRVISPTLI